jgi:putative ABC transport system permease protein
VNEPYLILKNLTRKPLRFGLTLFAIMIAFLIYGVLASFERSFNASIEDYDNDRMVTVNRINFTQPLPLAYVNRIRALPEIAKLTHSTWSGAFVRESKNRMAGFAVEAKTYFDTYPNIVIDPLERQAFESNRQGMAVGERLANKQGWKKGDRIPLQSNIYTRSDGSRTWEMTIEAIMRPKKESDDTDFLVFHYEYLNEARTVNRDMVHMIEFQTSDPARNDAVAQKIDAMFANSFAETQTDTSKAFGRAFIAQLGNIAFIITSVVSAAFFTILLIVGNTMMLTIRERTTEIAVLKTLGFEATRIFRLVLGESMFLSVLGGVAGLALAYAAMHAMRAALSDSMPNMQLDAVVIGRAAVIMLLLGIVTGLLPALNAMRLNIVTALGRG